MKTIPFLFLILLTGMLSCTTEKVEEDFITVNHNNDFLVFGTINGYCAGDCKQLFLLDSNGLFEYARKNDKKYEWRFKLEPLALDKMNVALDLNHVPEIVVKSLYNESDLPDLIADFDYFIYGKKDGILFELEFDHIDSTVHVDLRNYTERMKLVLSNIR